MTSHEQTEQRRPTCFLLPVSFQMLAAFYRQMSEQSLLESHTSILTGFRFHSAVNDPNHTRNASWQKPDSIHRHAGTRVSQKRSFYSHTAQAPLS